MTGTQRKKWAHDEAVLALGLYFQMPFAKIRSSAPEIVKLARLMGRSSASLSMKMDNFGRLDPSLAVKGISGLKNGSKLDKQVWDEFVDRREELSELYHELISKLKGGDALVDDDMIKVPPGMDAVRLSHYRINQSFFRKSVLSAYNYTCCITGLEDVRLLIASHIKPWAACDNGNERTDTTNGLCLNALHDRAFDKGLITLDEEMRVVVSKALKHAVSRAVFNDYFIRYEGKKIVAPERGRPSEEFLAYHRGKIFLS